MGTEIRTDASTFITAGSANGYGCATISAHAVYAGNNGNIPVFAINRVEGTSMYIRNMRLPSCQWSSSGLVNLSRIQCHHICTL